MSLEARDIEAIYSLSPQQRGMLFESLRAPGSGIFIEQAVLTLRGSLDHQALEQAWRHLFTRHSILRTAFVWQDRPEPLQVVLRRVESGVETVEDADDALEAFLIDDRERGFAPQQAPLMRLALLPASDGCVHLVWTVHHILMDGWCRARVFAELLSLYASLRTGAKASQLAGKLPAVRPYKTYIDWLSRRDLATAEAYWRDRLAGLCSAPLLPEASEPPDDPPPRYGGAKACLPENETASLKKLASRRRLTLNTVVQGAVALLLCRTSERREVVLGTTVSGRPTDLPGADSIVGPFVNTLPLRLHLPENGSFWSWLEEVQRRHLELREFEYCSEGQVHRWSGLPGSEPLYACALVFENYPLEPPAENLDQLGVEMIDREQQGARTKYLLTLLAFAEASLRFDLVYDGRRLADTGAQTLLTLLVRLLNRLAERPETRLNNLLAMISDEEIPRLWPVAASSPSSTDTTAPRHELEEDLADLWRQVLGSAPTGVHASFLESGGHSLLATELLGKIRHRFNSKLPLQTLFQQPTVAALAGALVQERAKALETADLQEHLAALGGDELPNLTSAQAGELWQRLGDAPKSDVEPVAAIAADAIAADASQNSDTFPSVGIQRLYFQARQGSDEAALPGTELSGVNLYIHLQCSGDVPHTLLASALNRLIQRHEPLRTFFTSSGEQRILNSVPEYPLAEIDLSHLRDEDRQRQVDLLSLSLRHVRARIDHWPLFDFLVQRLDARTLRLHGRIEALILDGESRDLLFHELRQLLAAPKVDLPEVGLTFRDYARSLPALQQSPAFREARSAWRKRLPELPPMACLPEAPHDSGPTLYQRGTQELLGRWRWRLLKARATRQGLTPSSIVTSVFARHLAAWSGQRSFTLPLVSNFRPDLHPDLKRTIGNFDTFYPIAITDAGAAIADLAPQIQDAITSVLETRLFTGVDLLLEQSENPILPPVRFNSLIEFSHPQHREGEDATATAFDLEQIDLSLTVPQSQLNCIVAETTQGALIALWQASSILPGDQLPKLQQAFHTTLRQLAGGKAAWTRPFD